MRGVVSLSEGIASSLGLFIDCLVELLVALCVD